MAQDLTQHCGLCDRWGMSEGCSLPSLQVLREADAALPPSSSEKLPSRVLHLPIAFGDRWTKAAIQRFDPAVNISRFAPSLWVAGVIIKICRCVLAVSCRRHRVPMQHDVLCSDWRVHAQVHEVSTGRCAVPAQQHRLLRGQQRVAGRR